MSDCKVGSRVSQLIDLSFPIHLIPNLICSHRETQKKVLGRWSAARTLQITPIKGVNGGGAVGSNAAASENVIHFGNEITALVIKQGKIRGLSSSSSSSVHFPAFLTLHNEKLDVQRVCLPGTEQHQFIPLGNKTQLSLLAPTT